MVPQVSVISNLKLKKYAFFVFPSSNYLLFSRTLQKITHWHSDKICRHNLAIQTIDGKARLDPLTLTPFYPIWQPKAQLVHHFTNSEQINPSLLHHFTPLGSPYLKSYLILIPSDKLPPHSYTFLTPLAAQILLHFNPSGQITPSLTLTPFYPPWQPNSYIILTPQNKLTPHSDTILPPLAAQLLAHMTPL